ncbi:hypothetical protein [Corallococcus exiguus]|uniref:hypothetical protein n=2 Tax=Corallococcus TaxID=83461 RepID=UPI00155F7442|nr:hypothetical protein [Corallococcus exiguus]NRD55083.1 hypothetical protein [Corallococcus exiguus]
MNPSSLRLALVLSCCGALAVGCDSPAKGSCQGTHLGQAVNWPIDGERSSLERTHPALNDNKVTYLALSYVTDSLLDKGVASIGVGITFNEELVIRSPTAYELVRGSEDELVAAGESSGLRWAGYYDPINDLRMGG